MKQINLVMAFTLAALPLAPAWAQPARPAAAGETAASPEAILAARVAQIRAMPPAASAAGVGAQRVELNAAWRVFGVYRDEAVPLLRRELAAELRSAKPSPQLLLDAACFLLFYGAEGDGALALQAALAIPPAAALDGPQLFRLTHAAAASRDRRLLPLIDHAFLRHAVSLPLPQQGSVIDETGVRVLLYGRFGAQGERHLAGLMKDASLAKAVLDVLLLVGGPDSLPAVLPLLESPDMDLFTRAATFLLRAGGPEGRQALLGLPTQGLSKEALDFLAPMREQLARQPMPGRDARRGNPPDAEVLRQLEVLESAEGRYEGVDPAAIVNSRLPKQELLERLLRIRERAAGRAANETLADIETTAAVINAVRYREQ